MESNPLGELAKYRGRIKLVTEGNKGVQRLAHDKDAELRDAELETIPFTVLVNKEGFNSSRMYRWMQMGDYYFLSGDYVLIRDVTHDGRVRRGSAVYYFGTPQSGEFQTATYGQSDSGPQTIKLSQNVKAVRPRLFSIKDNREIANVTWLPPQAPIVRDPEQIRALKAQLDTLTALHTSDVLEMDKLKASLVRQEAEAAMARAESEKLKGGALEQESLRQDLSKCLTTKAVLLAETARIAVLEKQRDAALAQARQWGPPPADSSIFFDFADEEALKAVRAQSWTDLFRQNLEHAQQIQRLEEQLAQQIQRLEEQLEAIRLAKTQADQEVLVKSAAVDALKKALENCQKKAAPLAELETKLAELKTQNADLKVKFEHAFDDGKRFESGACDIRLQEASERFAKIQLINEELQNRLKHQPVIDLNDVFIDAYVRRARAEKAIWQEEYLRLAERLGVLSTMPAAPQHEPLQHEPEAPTTKSPVPRSARIQEIWS